MILSEQTATLFGQCGSGTSNEIKGSQGLMYEALPLRSATSVATQGAGDGSRPFTSPARKPRTGRDGRPILMLSIGDVVVSRSN